MCAKYARIRKIPTEVGSAEGGAEHVTGNGPHVSKDDVRMMQEDGRE